MIKIISILTILVLFTACSEENLSIIIHSPENGSIYQPGDQINIKYTVTDDIDITSIIYFTDDLDTARVDHSQLAGIQTEYSGYLIAWADTPSNNYNITIRVTDEDMNNTVEETLSLVIQ